MSSENKTHPIVVISAAGCLVIVLSIIAANIYLKYTRLPDDQPASIAAPLYLSSDEKDLLALREEHSVWQNRREMNSIQFLFWSRASNLANDNGMPVDLYSVCSPFFSKHDVICVRELRQIENEIDRRWGRNARSLLSLSESSSNIISDLKYRTEKMVNENLDAAAISIGKMDTSHAYKAVIDTYKVCESNVSKLESFLKVRIPKIAEKSEPIFR